MKKEMLIDIFDDLPYKAKEIILNDKTFELIDEVSCMLEYLESPIEKILYIALIKEIKKTNYYWYIDAQTEIECDEKTYRADFTIEYDEICNNNLDENFKLDIECDGYEFHQKTKEQVRKDNEREYNLKTSGWDILRFSGSQIYNEPTKCAKDILKYIALKNNIKIGD